MSNYTKGPWAVVVNRETCVMDSAGNILAQTCQTCWPDEGVDLAEDNARLIAAAPELLEALQTILKRSSPNGNDMTLQRISAVAAAAIAKATQGEA